MTTISGSLHDSSTMLRRDLLRQVRYPGLTLMIILLPVLLLLMFVYVFGGTLGAGLPGEVADGAGGRAAYLAYVTPGLLVAACASAAQATAISVSMDVTEGIVARFRTMAISPGSILSGHVLGAVLQSLVAMAAVLAASVVLGYRPAATTTDWLVLAGLLLLTAVAITWIAVAMGLAARSVETASNMPMILFLLPFLSSGFVPVDSMPSGLAWFAEHQPFTSIIDSIRGALSGSIDGPTLLLAVGWCVVIALVGYLWARARFRRERVA